MKAFSPFLCLWPNSLSLTPGLPSRFPRVSRDSPSALWRLSGLKPEDEEPPGGVGGEIRRWVRMRTPEPRPKLLGKTPAQEATVGPAVQVMAPVNRLSCLLSQILCVLCPHFLKCLPTEPKCMSRITRDCNLSRDPPSDFHPVLHEHKTLCLPGFNNLWNVLCGVTSTLEAEGFPGRGRHVRC